MACRHCAMSFSFKTHLNLSEISHSLVASLTFHYSLIIMLDLFLIQRLSRLPFKVKIRQVASVQLVGSTALSFDLCVCSHAAGVCELQLLREVHLVQLLGDASPGPRLQPVRRQRLPHQVQSHQLPRLQETAAALRPLPHEHGHACFQLPR